MELIKSQFDVGLTPSDPEASVAYYRDVLGFRQLPSAQMGEGLTQHRFVLGGHLLKLNAYADPPERRPGGVERAIGMRLLAFVIDDYEDMLARLDTHGRRHTALKVGPSTPYRVSLTKDPDGTVLELVGLVKPGGKALRTRVQVGMTVADAQRARRFWGETLGLQEETPMELGGTMGTRYGFHWGESTLKFWQISADLPAQTGDPRKHAGLRTCTMLVKDLAAARQFLLDRGVPIVQGPTEIPGVCSLLFFSDPDDNWFELVELYPTDR
ncbi:MAG: VOC family protein [Myxococcales bacterium]|nr:VOC family protein [Myxococcales bacterium]MDD9966045.1 VOC family protein [Myxococcales bacterium]